MDERDRRAFVIHVIRTEEEVKEKLETQGYKQDILNAIKDPSAFKWHLLNEVEYDREMFFTRPPMNEDKEALIKQNRTEFEKLMHTAFEERSFPFTEHFVTSSSGSQIGDRYNYRGIINSTHLYKALSQHPLFRQKNVYFTSDHITDVIKQICKKWPNGEWTRKMNSREGRKNVYLVDENWTFEGIPLGRLTEDQLGELWDIKAGDEGSRLIKNFPVSPEITVSATEGSTKDNKNHKTGCWNCKEALETITDGVCPDCEYAIKCPNCGKCACDKPGSKIKKKYPF